MSEARKWLGLFFYWIHLKSKHQLPRQQRHQRVWYQTRNDLHWWGCSITDHLFNLRVLSKLCLSAHFVNFHSVCKMFYAGIFQKEPPEDKILGDIRPVQFIHEYGLILFDQIKYSVPYLCFLYCSCNWSQAHCYVVSWILPDPYLHIGTTLATSKFPGSLPSLSKLSTISVKGFSISLATSFNIWDVIHLGWVPRQLLTRWCWEVVLCGGRAQYRICYITSGQEMEYLEKFPIPGVAKPARSNTFTASAVTVQWCREGASGILHSSAAAQKLPLFCWFFPSEFSCALSCELYWPDCPGNKFSQLSEGNLHKYLFAQEREMWEPRPTFKQIGEVECLN